MDKLEYIKKEVKKSLMALDRVDEKTIDTIVEDLSRSLENPNEPVVGGALIASYFRYELIKTFLSTTEMILVCMKGFRSQREFLNFLTVVCLLSNTNKVDAYEEVSTNSNHPRYIKTKAPFVDVKGYSNLIYLSKIGFPITPKESTGLLTYRGQMDFPDAFNFFNVVREMPIMELLRAVSTLVSVSYIELFKCLEI